jgi:hypothetical protein
LRTALTYLAFTLFTGYNFHAQKPYQHNLWQSIAVKSILYKMALNVDFGYRSHDCFVRNSRTALGRVVFDYEIRPAHRLGIGYAYFEHYKTGTTIENRPFIQYSFEKANAKTTFRLRFRNELRVFKQERLANRSRLQGSMSLMNSRIIQPTLSVELFFTPGKSHLIEQRYQFGIQHKREHLQGVLHYTLQIQSSVYYLQHIIGYQINYFIN